MVYDLQDRVFIIMATIIPCFLSWQTVGMIDLKIHYIAKNIRSPALTRM